MVQTTELDRDFIERLESAFGRFQLSNIERLDDKGRSELAYRVRLALDNRTDYPREEAVIQQHSITDREAILAFILFSKRAEVPSVSLFVQLNKLIPGSKQ